MANSVAAASRPVVGRTAPVQLPRWARRAIDVAIVVAFVVIGFLVRKDGLPQDGLWFDDSWVAAGVLRGNPANLMITGTGHPAFTALLMVWNAVGGGSLTSLSYPALLAGVAGPPALYLALRYLGFQRAISAVLGGALVVADVHVLYSGRVKGYTLDTLLVTGLAVAVPVLARVRWRWPVAVAWVAGAWLIGAFSGYALVASACAMFVLFLHPNGDRLVRVVALAVQGVGQLAFYLAAQRFADLAEIEARNQITYDIHMELHLNPIDFARESIEHLQRIAGVFPGGSDGWLTLFALVAVAGLVIGSVWGGRPTVTLPAQFFLLMMAGAFVGSLLGKFPFGPSVGNIVSNGGRHALWLVPGMAFGIAVVLQRIRDVAGWWQARAALDAALIVVAVAVLMTGYGPAALYPLPGSASAAAYVDSERQPGDAVIVTSVAAFQFMVSSHEPLTLVPRPDNMVGFVADYDDPRIDSIGIWGATGSNPAAIRAVVGDADRVFVVGMDLFAKGDLNAVAAALEPEGFTATKKTFGAQTVYIWTR